MSWKPLAVFVAAAQIYISIGKHIGMIFKLFFTASYEYEIKTNGLSMYFPSFILATQSLPPDCNLECISIIV